MKSILKHIEEVAPGQIWASKHYASNNIAVQVEVVEVHSRFVMWHPVSRTHSMSIILSDRREDFLKDMVRVK